MKKIQILDCTLRDGGYINNWQFDDYVTTNIIQAIQEAQIDIIECGYLNSSKLYDSNSTIFSDIQKVKRVFKEDNPTTKVVMINYGDFEVENLPHQKESWIKGIRLAFHKKDLQNALKVCSVIIEKGYDLFVQPMLTATYSERELFNLIQKTNDLNPYAFYIVDSFGSMNKQSLLPILKLVDIFLNSNIKIGFHSHNNMQMAFSNSVEFLTNLSNRDLIVDSSIFGMGRGAGNLNSEIIAHYLNNQYSKSYKLEPLLDVIDNFLEKIHKETYWGFSVAHFLSGKSEIHPNYATYLLNKKTSSISTINLVLNSISDNKKNSFDKEYIEKLYIQHINTLCKTQNNKLDFLHNLERPILIVASGNSVNNEIESINEFIQHYNPLIIMVNHINPNIKYDFVFFSNQKRFSEFYDSGMENSLLLTSNIIFANKNIVDFSSLYNFQDIKSDNASILLLNLLIMNDIRKVNVVGLDGYNSDLTDNYSYKEYSVNLDKQSLEKVNQDIYKALNVLDSLIKIKFLVSSIFQKEKKLSILGVIPARYKSSRFEGKPLCLINGVAMIERTYNQARKSSKLDKLVVATDDSRIIEFCKSRNIPTIMTSSQCLTGTDRIAEVSKTEDYDLYINIQGDEPVIDPKNIDLIVDEFLKYQHKYIAYNLYRNISIKEANSPTIIKVIVNENDELVYMSRALIPFNKSDLDQEFKKQVCVYGFTKEALNIFSKRDKTLNEQFEDIEILRYIDMGYKVKMLETEFDSIAVDIPSDIIKVENFLNLDL